MLARRLIGALSASQRRRAVFGSTERRRSRTYPAVGYTTSRILKFPGPRSIRRLGLAKSPPYAGKSCGTCSRWAPLSPVISGCDWRATGARQDGSRHRPSCLKRRAYPVNEGKRLCPWAMVPEPAWSCCRGSPVPPPSASTLPGHRVIGIDVTRTDSFGYGLLVAHSGAIGWPVGGRFALTVRLMV
jgi:hypothetical protein